MENLAMAMIKKGISNVSQPVQMVQDTFEQGDVRCEKCNEVIDIATSQNGVITCSKCGHQNKVQDMENSNAN